MQVKNHLQSVCFSQNLLHCPQTAQIIKIRIDGILKLNKKIPDLVRSRNYYPNSPQIKKIWI